jgi:hypothetical protein
MPEWAHLPDFLHLLNLLLPSHRTRLCFKEGSTPVPGCLGTCYPSSVIHHPPSVIRPVGKKKKKLASHSGPFAKVDLAFIGPSQAKQFGFHWDKNLVRIYKESAERRLLHVRTRNFFCKQTKVNKGRIALIDTHPLPPVGILTHSDPKFYPPIENVSKISGGWSWVLNHR